MKLASTKQFRHAVRFAAILNNASIWNSWTDIPPNDRISPTTKRYVGFAIGNGKSRVVAIEAEAVLNRAGLTAHTRVGKRDSDYMVRGTCEIND